MEGFSIGGACGDVSGWQGMSAEGVQWSIWAMIEKFLMVLILLDFSAELMGSNPISVRTYVQAAKLATGCPGEVCGDCTHLNRVCRQALA